MCLFWFLYYFLLCFSACRLHPYLRFIGFHSCFTCAFCVFNELVWWYYSKPRFF